MSMFSTSYQEFINKIIITMKRQSLSHRGVAQFSGELARGMGMHLLPVTPTHTPTDLSLIAAIINYSGMIYSGYGMGK